MKQCFLFHPTFLGTFKSYGWYIVTANLVGSNDCYDQVRRNSCYDEAGRNSCYNEAGRIGILLRILRSGQV